MEEVTSIEHIHVLALQPGDTIVVRMQTRLSAEQAERLKAQWQGKFEGHEVLIVDGCLDIGVLSKVDRLGAIERKLDQLVAALAADEEEEPRFSLDGQPAGAERDGNQSLG
jgi:hypothetical protein